MPAASYERIHYGLRPAKNIERKMISDVLRRLREFAPLSQYRYIGFGSTYFSDFSLFHKALGIRTMTSIEKDEENEDRFEFNKPFACIDIEFGLSTAILPTIDWASNNGIVWLDYDGMLDGTVLADIQFVCTEARPGTVLLVTVNAHPERLADDGHDGGSAAGSGEQRVNPLRERVGPENVPVDIQTDAQLGKWRLADVSRRIIDNTIIATLRDRNAPGLPPQDEIQYRQLFNFRYQDGAKMATVGGLLYRSDQAAIVEKCSFGDFSFVEDDADAYHITVPNLTFKEMRHLNAQLPEGDPLTAPGVSGEAVDDYARVYRFFPAFVDAEI